MPRNTCCVTGCKTNYKSELKERPPGETISVFRFPTDEIQRDIWIKVIPRDNLEVHDDTVVCSKHWPPGFETVSKKGKHRDRPKNPPSIWPNVPKSQIPTPPIPPRSTTKTLCSTRNVQEDQLDEFLEVDVVDFTQLQDKLLTNKADLNISVVSFLDSDNSILTIQSTEYMNGVPLFVMHISEDLSFENFHLGVKCGSLPLAKTTT